MTHAIYSIDKIEREAQAAALIYATPNEACPYPFGTTAAHVFKQAFLAKRGSMSAQDQPKPKPATDWSAA